MVVGGVTGGLVLYSYAGELPTLKHLSAQALPQSTRIYARDGTTLLEERYVERRTVVPLTAVSWNLRHATISIEDKDFYNHGAVNPLRMVTAGIYDILHRSAAQGASTISQQLIKNYLLGPQEAQQRTIARKIREALLAMQLEQHYTKDQILEMYLNTIFYGNQSFGIESASETYFGIHASELDLAEASFLAGLPQRPSAFDPFRPDGFQLARLRQQDVLNAMVRDHDVSRAVADAAYQEDLQAKLATQRDAAISKRAALAPHFVDYIWGQLEQRYDPGFLLRGGLKIVTTLDPKVQQLAQKEVKDGVKRFSKSNRVNNSAMLVQNPHTGEILAMVGSADYSNVDIGGQVNYTVSPRQPGSSFKPYTYVTALENGYSPASPLLDKNGTKAFPGYPVHDWDGREMGLISLRTSLQQSRNISSVHLFQDVGMDKVFSTVRSLGVTTPLDPSLPTTLGASPLEMIQHVSAYSAFANGGTRVRPITVLSVQDASGKVLERTDPKPDSGPRVLPQPVAYILTDILKGAVRPPMSMPVAAKSGTTSDFKDAWYVGYTTDLAVSIWMGRTVTKPHPANESMNYLWGETGPGYVWHDFMRSYYAHRRPADWRRPSEVVAMNFCKQTGQPVDQAVPKLTVSDIFIKGLQVQVVVPTPAASPAPIEAGADATQPTVCDSPTDITTATASPSPSPGPSDEASPPVVPSIGPLPSVSPSGVAPSIIPSGH